MPHSIINRRNQETQQQSQECEIKIAETKNVEKHCLQRPNTRLRFIYNNLIIRRMHSSKGSKSSILI